MEDNLTDIDLHLSDASKNHLLQTAKWSKFLAIVSFIFIGIGTIYSFIFYSKTSELYRYAGSRGSSVPMTSLVGMLIVLLIFAYASFLLFQFSNKLKFSIENTDNFTLEDAFNSQRKLYQYWGILTIIYLVIVVLLFLVSLGSGR
jgi:Ca2+/H+ antiporter